MVQTGAPDFQHYEQWTDVPLFSGDIAGAAIPVQVGIFNVSQWAYLQTFFVGVNGPLKLTFEFYSSSTLITRTGIRTINADSFSGFQNEVSITCLGRVVRVTCTTNGPQPLIATITLSGSNRAGPTVAGVLGYQLIELTGVGLGIGATIITNFGTLFTGPAHVSWLSNVVPVLFDLFWLDPGGTQHIFHERVTQTINVPVTDAPVFIPPAPCSVKVTNLSGAAGAYNAYVMPDAFRIGA